MNNKIYLILVIVIGLGFGIWGLGFGLVGCGHPLQQVNLDAPLINSVYPRNGATGIELTPAINATFDKSMDLSTINTATFTLAAAAGAISGSVTYNPNSKTANFYPSVSLTANTKYTATISDQVKESGGNRLEAPYSWSFTVGGFSEARGITDESFSDGTNRGYGAFKGTGNSMILDLQNRILVTGGKYHVIANSLKGYYGMTIWRILPDGSLDQSFGSGGSVYDATPTNESQSSLGNSITIDAQGKILVSGYVTSPDGSGLELALWRYNLDGTPDISFGSKGMVVAPYNISPITGWKQPIAFNLSGDIFVAAYTLENVDGQPSTVGHIFQFKPDGTLNNILPLSATPAGVVFRDETRATDALGKSLVTGSLPEPYDTYGQYGITYMATWRYNSDGTTDESFGDSGMVSYHGGNVAGESVLSDSLGRVIVMGNIGSLGLFSLSPSYGMAIWRYK